MDAGYDPMGRGMWFMRTEDGLVLHRRDEIESISASSVAGKSFSTKLAKLGVFTMYGSVRVVTPLVLAGVQEVSSKCVQA